MQLFYAKEAPVGNTLSLTPEETRHCKVLRKQAGDKLDVTDGKGHLYVCTIQSLKADTAELMIDAVTEIKPSRPYWFHLIIAPTKQNERMEWMLEKAVEIGLDEISFIETEHSEKHRINFDRLERIALSAMKQSNQFRMPLIHPLRKKETIDFQGPVFIAHCLEESPRVLLRDAAMDCMDKTRFTVLIGPEGDFSPAEIAWFTEKGFVAVSLGPNRLRTETAGLYSTAVLSSLF